MNFIPSIFRDTRMAFLLLQGITHAWAKLRTYCNLKDGAGLAQTLLHVNTTYLSVKVGNINGYVAEALVFTWGSARESGELTAESKSEIVTSMRYQLRPALRGQFFCYQTHPRWQRMLDCHILKLPP
jgi:hypothetical protein